MVFESSAFKFQRAWIFPQQYWIRVLQLHFRVLHGETLVHSLIKVGNLVSSWVFKMFLYIHTLTADLAVGVL